ncbi:MAG: glycoside hydrolase family 99-like domain-containing protein [Thermoguttaceae bacterium]
MSTSDVRERPWFGCVIALLFATACFFAFIPALADAQQLGKPKAMVGAYYFDGWSTSPPSITLDVGMVGRSRKIKHVTKLLATDYADRKPVWGWEAGTVEIMQKQIDYCADHDIAFWAIDWYYPEGKNKATPLNNALELYLKAPNCRRLKFCLLVANHGGFRIGPKDWNDCCKKWIELFQKPTYLRLNDRPLIIFFSPHELQRAFGSVKEVRKALDSLRAKAKDVGIPDVVIAACTGPDNDLTALAKSGYTLLTGYNYSFAWQNGTGERPFQKLIEGNKKILDQFARKTPLPYVPVITIGWDRRPWEQGKFPPEKMSGWYVGRTPKLVEEFVRLGVRWLDEHPDKTLPQRLLLLFAWNENGEGGYLTPTDKDGEAYLDAVQRAVTENR